MPRPARRVARYEGAKTLDWKPKFKSLLFLGPRSSVRATHHVLPVIPVINKEKKMLKKQVILLFALVLTFPLAAGFAEKAAAPAQEARRDGRRERRPQG